MNDRVGGEGRGRMVRTGERERESVCCDGGSRGEETVQGEGGSHLLVVMDSEPAAAAPTAHGESSRSQTQRTRGARTCAIECPHARQLWAAVYVTSGRSRDPQPPSLSYRTSFPLPSLHFFPKFSFFFFFFLS